LVSSQTISQFVHISTEPRSDEGDEVVHLGDGSEVMEITEA